MALTRVTVGVPTIDSAGYIALTLQRLAAQIEACPPRFEIQLAACVNGPERAATLRAIEGFACSHGDLDVIALERPEPGRNGALNALLDHAEARHSDLVHFFDDDVEMAPGTLARNLEALEAAEAPLLVGAALRVRLRAPRGPRDLWPWLLRRVFAAPYLPGVEAPRFCEGFCFGAALRHMPRYPEDATGITDDTFLSNTFAARAWRAGAEAPATLKPEGSIGYMEVPSCLREWRAQQVRVHAGILRSFAAFEEAERAFLARHFAWPFAFLPETQTPLRGQGLIARAFALIYRRLHAANHRAARARLEAGVIPAWGAAPSTKPQRG